LSTSDRAELPNHTTIKIVDESRNVGYAMSHAAAKACTVHTAAGCRAWHWRLSSDGYSACSNVVRV